MVIFSYLDTGPLQIGVTKEHQNVIIGFNMFKLLKNRVKG